jgi:hypothetical protein
MARKARRKTATGRTKKSTSRKKAKVAAKKTAGKKVKAAPKKKRALKAKPKSFGQRVEGAFKAVIGTISDTGALRDKLERPGESETE